MRRDHERLDRVLQAAVSGNAIDVVKYQPFRSGLLRHIGIEEKILIPFVRSRRSEPLALVKQLKLDHGAIAGLLVPTPTVAIIAQLRAVLAAHNPLEEGEGGLYEICGQLSGADEEALIVRADLAPPVPLAPHYDGPRAFANIERLLRLAGRIPE
jgi:hypothetical protein